MRPTGMAILETILPSTHTHTHHPNHDVPGGPEPGSMPVEPDEGPVPPAIPDDPEDDRLVDPES